ncbi:MAG: DNA mismatch repair endonuclease MutL [Coprococcus sp.]|nr:DNA mismatch repair endonuclease MutL [Coprococcus sp.]
MIRVLDADTIDKIAAGEVIERPSSVVKELVENAIDSGATAITVEIKEGGLSFIRITDNGCGIPEDEVPKAFLRHATSKLVTAEDLLRISSLGFRGEALSSIAAVAQVEMITKTKDSLTGTRYQIQGSQETDNSQIGCPDGTTIIVRNLFYNTPARKKYMKSASTEMSYIYDLVCRISMSHTEISFKLIVNGTDKLFTSGNGKLKDIIYHIYGKDITSNLLEVDNANDFLHIHGYVARPCISRGNRSFEDYYVNSRYIKSKTITKAVEDAFRTFVMIHKFPFTVLNFDIKPELIDVNVHPAKMELKFENEQDIYDFTYKVVREALLFKELIPAATPGKDKPVIPPTKRNVGKNPEPFEVNRRTIEQAARTQAQETRGVNTVEAAKPLDTVKPAENTGFADKASMLFKENIGRYKAVSENTKPNPTAMNTPDMAKPDLDIQNTPNAAKPDLDIQNTPNAAKPDLDIQNTSDAVKSDSATLTAPDKDSLEELDMNETYTQQTLFTEQFLTEKARVKHRIIGQLFETYWLIEYENKLFIMDQHAAHEKVKFEELMANYNAKNIISQYLMPPAVITLSAAEIDFLKTNMELFEALGYQLEAFGDNEYKLNAVPANLFGLDGRELFIDFIGELAEDTKKTTIDVFISKLSTMACKAAIKGNTAISFQEADALITQLMTLENPYTCPHGRPTIISMTESDIEKKFKRIV